MWKRLLLILLAVAMCSSLLFAAACNDGSEENNEEGGGTVQNPSDETPEDETKYEGDMLYNGFDSVADMYRVSQLYEWNYTPLGKLSVVGADNFIPEEDNSGTEDAAAAVVAQIEALPSVSEVTFADKDAVAKARRAYGELTDEGKLLVTNLDKLKELEASEVFAGYYTVGDFGGGFTADISSAASWTAYSGTLRDPMQGTIIFNVSGIAANMDGAFYLTLFQDPSTDAGQSSDGVAIWVRTNNNTLLPQNSTNAGLAFETGDDGESKTITPDKTYTFTVGYEVAEDYAKLTISIKIEDESGDVIADQSVDVTEFTTTNFGAQTIKSWLQEDENVARHQTFFISTGNSEGVSISSAWTGTRASDYEEPVEEEDPHDEADLSPRQGEGALRVYYERGTFTEILARFDRSALSGMPIEDELGGFSVRIYNDSAEEKTVTLSLMQQQNVVVDLEGGEFTLAPYAWTECKVTLDPIIVNFLADDLIGLNIRFANTTESVYYIDDLRVQFGQVYTDEIREDMEKVDSLVADIATLDGETITAEEQEILEGYYQRYLDLPQAYRFTVENYDILETAISDYMNALIGAEDVENGGETILRFDQLLGLTQVGEFSGGTTAFSEDVVCGEAEGSLQLNFNGSTNWVTIPISPLTGSGYDETHIWVNNTTEDVRYAFQLNWHVSDAAYNEKGEDAKLVGGYVIEPGSGWIELVFRSQFTLSELNITAVDADNNAVITSGSLYVGNVIRISNAPDVVAQIEALPEYTEGYSEANKEAVAAARAAYNALSLDTQENVTNIDKLIGIEAEIWREGFGALPASPDDITSYSDEVKTAIDALRASYNNLDNAVKRVVSEDEALLQEFEEKIASFAVEYVESLINALTEKESYTAQDIAAIKLAKTEYDALDEENQAELDTALVEKLNRCLEDIESYYTLSDLSANSAYSGFSSGDTSIGSWAYAGGNLVDPMKGTIVFNATGIAEAMDGAMYLVLFHDGSINAAQAGDGISIWLRTVNNTLLPQNTTNTAIGFNENKQISSNGVYTFYIGYEVASDYSKLTLSIRIEDSNGDVIAEGSQDIASISLSDFDTQTVAGWLRDHENVENHQTFYINGGNSTELVVSSAW